MDPYANIKTIIEVILGIGAVATYFAYMFQAKNSKRLIEILKDELEAHKTGGERLVAERNEYREKLHDCANTCHKFEVENAELRGRTDFTPFSQEQAKRHEAQSAINEKMLLMLTGISTLLKSLNEKLEITHAPK